MGISIPWPLVTGYYSCFVITFYVVASDSHASGLMNQILASHFQARRHTRQRSCSIQPLLLPYCYILVLVMPLGIPYFVISNLVPRYWHQEPS